MSLNNLELWWRRVHRAKGCTELMSHSRTLIYIYMIMITMGNQCQRMLLRVGGSVQDYLSGSGVHEQADWRKRGSHCKYSFYGRYHNAENHTLI